MRLPPPVALVLPFAVLLGAGSAASAPAYEAVPAPKASTSLPDALRKGPSFAVREDGVAEGFLTRWQLESDYGLFDCASRRLLQIRIREIASMAKVTGSDPGNEALSGMQSRLKDIPTSMIGLIDDPVGTFEGAAEGAKRTLGRVGGLFSKRKATDYEDKGADAFLFSSEKRKAAAELGVDVYSTNPKLQAFLGDLAKARRAGGFAVDLAKMAIPGGVGTAVSGLSTTADLTSLLRDRTPAELDGIADERMEQAGVASSLRRKFLATRRLSPTHRTAIAGALVRLSGVANLGALVEASAETQSEAQALMHMEQALLLVRQHEEVEPIVALDATGGVVAAFTKSGKMFVPVPIDVLAFVAEVPAVVEALLSMPGAAEAPSRTVALLGVATPAAVEYLRGRGFTVVPSAGIDLGAPR